MKVIKHIPTGLYLVTYSTGPDNCTWGNKQDALQVENGNVDSLIASLGNSNDFIGENPKVIR